MTAEMSLCQLFHSSSPTCTTCYCFCWVKKRVYSNTKQKNKENKAKRQAVKGSKINAKDLKAIFEAVECFEINWKQFILMKRVCAQKRDRIMVYGQHFWVCDWEKNVGLDVRNVNGYEISGFWVVWCEISLNWSNPLPFPLQKSWLNR